MGAPAVAEQEAEDVDLRDVEATLAGVVTGAPRPLAGPVAAALGPVGKRLRPRVLLLAHRAAGGDAGDPRAVRAAAAVELLHVASLAVDDVLDGSGLRRGAPAVHVTHGGRLALLAGGHLGARSLRLVLEGSRQPEADAEAVAAAFEEVVAAEARVAARPSGLWTRRGWEEVAAGKTGALFALAADLGARRGGDTALAPALTDFGRRLGVAFQAADDLLDLEGAPERTGKPTGNDAASGAPNLARIAGAGRARDLARRYADEAVAVLDALPASAARDALKRLATAAADRRA